jgi:sulfide:quinone oxidoreductase
MEASRNCKVAIVGAGTAGIAVAARLAKHFQIGEVVVFDSAETHYYQPLWTLVGAGICSFEESARPISELIPPGVKWVKEKVLTFQPEANVLNTPSGSWNYQWLVVCPGIQVNWSAISGLPETLGRNGVCSNYSDQHVNYTWDQFQSFHGGRALFTFPKTPVKCAGAPQKIMYLFDDYLRRHGKRDSAEIHFMSAGEAIFGVPKYKKALQELIERRQIKTSFKRNLIAIDGAKKTATFELLGTNQTVEEKFDFIHVCPPMSAPQFIKESPLANADGWIDVNKHTLQHNKFSNVFGLGDASSLPTSRTGAAIRKQAPVLIENLLAAMQEKSPEGHYNGYSSCPIVTGYHSLILAEFDYDGNPTETFPFDQSKERWSMYMLKRHVLPVMYWQGMMKGRA